MSCRVPIVCEVAHQDRGGALLGEANLMTAGREGWECNCHELQGKSVRDCVKTGLVVSWAR